MRHLILWSGLFLILALALPAGAADDQKDADKNKDAAKAAKKDDPKKYPKAVKSAKKKKGKAEEKAEQKAEKLVTAGQFVGYITEVSGNSQKDFTVQVRFKYLEPNLQAQIELLRRQQQLAIQQRQIMFNPNPVQRRQQLVQLLQQAQQQPGNLFNEKEFKKDVKLRAADDVKVRSRLPPVDYDDKGHVKRYSAKELKELRGAGNLPGFTSDWDNLRPGQLVRVYLAKKKEAPPPKVKKKPQKKGKGKDDDDADDDKDFRSNRPEVAVVVILVDPPEDKDK